MAVTRQDLVTKLGVYRLVNLDGEWCVHSYAERPSITMRRLSDGALTSFDMESMENLRALRLRGLDHKPCFPQEMQEAVAEVIRQPTSDEISKAADDILKEMLNDGVNIIEMVTSGKKLSAEHKELISSWSSQVRNYIGASQDEK